MRLLLFLIPLSYAQLEVMSNNLKGLDQSIIQDIKEDKFDEVTVQDILSSVKLKNEIDHVIESMTPGQTSAGDIGTRARFYQYKGDRQQHVGSFLYNLAMDKSIRNTIEGDRYKISSFRFNWGKEIAQRFLLVMFKSNMH